MADLNHNCGIAAIYIDPSKGDVNGLFPNMYKALLNLQNRGQLSAGITTFNHGRSQLLSTYKNTGQVSEVFSPTRKGKRENLQKKFYGNAAIGHVRYATCGIDDPSYAQPFERQHGRKWKWFSFCFNGNLANYAVLKKNLLEKTDYHITRDTDTEIIMHYLARGLKGHDKPDLVKVFNHASQIFEGAYTIAFLNADGDMAVARDPFGFRPLCYGEKDGMFVAASESIAVSSCGIDEVKSLEPGHMILIKDGEISFKKYADSPRKSHCFFEWVYFSNVASVLDDHSVYLTRSRLGSELAKIEEEKPGNDLIVVSVPDTSKPIGDSMAFELKVRPMEGLIRNRYVGRTFIEGESRGDKVRNKFAVLKDVVKGKRVLLVDDSIVRGTTMKRIINFIRQEGEAREVHVRVSCPPIMAPCFYGIDMSTVTELFAPHYADKNENVLPKDILKKMADDLGADSLVYVPIDAIPRSIGAERQDLCLACLNADYPTEYSRTLYRKALENGKNGGCGRTYE